MRQEGEPSVEEILESIKKVIARDGREAVREDRTRRVSASAAAQPPLSRAIPENDDEDDSILDLSEAVAHLAEELDEYDGEDDGEDPDFAEEGLTNSSAADAMRQSLAALAMLSEPGQPPQIVRSGETSLEGLVREMLRPMLAQWLDRNLPDMVEKLVKAEIARIAGKKR